MSLITQDQIKAERLRAMARVFGKADSILIGEPVVCKVVDEGHIKAPGYSTGTEISLNLPEIGNVETTDDIIKVTGLNFHELAHCMFTPRDNTWLVKQVKQSQAFQHFNMLEDQRIESMLSSLYPAIEPYFVMTVMKYIAAHHGQWETAHALTHGRRYLPAEVRKQLQMKFKHQGIRQRLEELIDQYRVMVFPRDQKDGLKVIIEFKSLMEQLGFHNQPQDPYGHSSGNRPDITEGEASEEDQDAGSQWVEYRDDEEDEADDDNDSDDTGNGGGKSEDDSDDTDDSDGGSGEGDSDDDSEDGDGEGGTGDDDLDDETEEVKGAGNKGSKSDKDGGNNRGGKSEDDDADDDKGSSNGVGDGSAEGAPKPQVVSDKDLEDMMNAAAQAAASLPEVQSDAKAKEASMKAEAGSIPNLDTKSYQSAVCTPDYMFASNAFKKQLSKMWVDSDPGWHQHKSSGRVNVQRAMRGGDLDTVFDSWDEGKNDATSIEMVMLVDFSSSMRGIMRETSQALWAIKRAVESIGGEVTVIGFNQGAVTMYDKHTKADRSSYRLFGADGMTNPTRALDQARMIFHYSKKVHKICLFITDGAWSNEDHANNVIKLFRSHNIMTALAFISTYDMGMYQSQPDVIAQFTHGVDSYEFVKQPTALVDLAKKIVKQAMTIKV